MNPSKLYVPNPQKWVSFFDRVSKGLTTLNQSGGARQSRVISVESPNSKQNANQLPLKAVSPAQQTVLQAKSELERENIKPSDAADMIQKPARRRRRRTAKSGKIKKIGRSQKGGAKRANRKTAHKRKSVNRRNKKVKRSGGYNKSSRQDIFGKVKTF